MSVYQISRKPQHKAKQEKNYSLEFDSDNFTKNIEDIVSKSIEKSLFNMSFGNTEGVNISSNKKYDNSYKNDNALSKLADSMIEEREIKETNSKSIGSIQETKKDIDDDIDFLSGIE